MNDVVRVTGLQFAWSDAGPTVLDIEGLRIGQGERIFVSGASGSGKSTLLNLLAGTISPDVGTVEIGGTDIAALRGGARDSFRADRIGFIFQMFNLVPYLSVMENVSLPCRFSAGRRKKAEARSGTVASEARLLLAAMQLDGNVLDARSVTRLSVGQQQRVAAARALIGAPPLVIADEPTSSLDENARRHFIDLVFAEVSRAGSTLVFVSHDQTLAPMFDRTIRLEKTNRAAFPGGSA